MANLISQIVDAVGAVSRDGSKREVLAYSPELRRRNECLLFVKPEVTGLGGEKLARVLKLVFSNLAEAGVEITGATALGARYMREHRLIEGHYGVINEIARLGAASLVDAARQRFAEVFGRPFEGAPVLGAFEFLRRYPYFNAESVNVLWENMKNHKLAGGTYCERIAVYGTETFVLNGFHPYQVEHYVRDGASIAAFPVESDTSWAALRDSVIGATNPHAAAPGSIRRMLLERAGEFGIAEVSQGYNCVHLSAGPLEAVVELIRFMSEHAGGRVLGPSDTGVGRALVAAGLEESRLRHFLGNPKIERDGEVTSAFDATEKMDVAECAGLLRNAH